MLTQNEATPVPTSEDGDPGQKNEQKQVQTEESSATKVQTEESSASKLLSNMEVLLSRVLAMPQTGIDKLIVGNDDKKILRLGHLRHRILQNRRDRLIKHLLRPVTHAANLGTWLLRVQTEVAAKQQ
ncbi:uncharacterized protein LOC125232379 [Leguminivora glycinivorella]|uniref:uncharacterized protein LOC125232379 n=1 Tax=Leguminivora glycinivorella TaxID=1035111 RepID=UPI00200F41EA|nr:uncharacterized protein LOC125232379 [Leguminivora glycinivorella]